MSRIHAGLGILALFCLAGWWLRTQSPTEPASESDQARPSAQMPARPEFEPVERQDVAEVPTSRWVEETEEPAEIAPLPEAPEGARAGELTVREKDPVAFRDMLEKAAAEGLRPSRVIDDLGMALFTGLSVEEQARLRAIAGKNSEVGYNYDVYTPDFPGSGAYGTGQSQAYFDDQAREFLGLPNDPRWGEGVRVAVLDNGVLKHSSLSGLRLSEMDLAPSAGNADSDYRSHGTAVTSILAGTAPGAEVMSVRVLNESGGGDSFTLAEGIVRAVDAGASVLSMSLGSYGDSAALRQAVSYATEKGVALVASTGNDGVEKVTYPAGYDQVVGVAAVDANGEPASFSNYGKGVELAAPGVGVRAAWEEDSEVLLSGTSASTPFVSGAIAGLMADNPGMSAHQAVQKLMSTATDAAAAGEDEHVGKGLLDVERALRVNDPSFSDAAVTGFWLDLSQAAEEGKANLYVTLQNRGNNAYSQGSLDVELAGDSHQFVYSGWNGGETRSEVFELPVEALLKEEGVPVEARLQVTGNRDEKSDNNARKGVLRVKAREE